MKVKLLSFSNGKCMQKKLGKDTEKSLSIKFAYIKLHIKLDRISTMTRKKLMEKPSNFDL